MNASLVLAERTDVLLADLPSALAALSDSPSFAIDKVVLVVATESSTLLPCCGQSLGYRNQQLSKLWTAAHLKTEACGAYWKNVHLLCVRKLRKNSAYAKEDEVLTILDDSTAWAKQRFLHQLRPVTSSSASKPNSRPALAPRISTIQTPVTAPTSKQRRLSTKPSLTSLNGRSPTEAAPTAKPRSSLSSARTRLSDAGKDRSPVVTRRKSSVLKPDNKSPVTAPAAKTMQAVPSNVAARRTSTASTTASARPITRRSSVASLANAAPTAAGRPKAVVSRVVSAPSAIPTSTRRLSADLLGKDGAGSPGIPLGPEPRRASIATSPISQPATSLRRSLLGMSQNASTSSIANDASTALKEHESRLVHLSETIAQLKTDLSSTTSRNSVLETELSTLKKQKSLLEKGNQVLIGEMKRLKEQLGMQEEAAELLAKSWEKRCRDLGEENARLQDMVSHQKGRDASGEDEGETSFESEGESTAKTFSEALTPIPSPPTTPLHFLTPAVGSIPTGKTPSYAFHTLTAQHPPKPSLNQPSSTPFFTPAATGLAGPATPSGGSAIASSRKVRTPASAAKRGGGGKKTIGIWKRLAKRRLFGL